MPIVYVTTNTINGNRYLGKSCHGRPYYMGSGLHVGRAIAKYGKAAFTRRTLCIVETKEEAARIERELSLAWNVVNDPAWYNMKVGGDGGSAPGRVVGEETRRKLTKCHLGKPSWNTGLKGKGDPRCKLSEEWKLNHSKKITGRTHSEKSKQLMALKASARRHTQETKDKIRTQRTGKPLTPEHRQHISDSSSQKDYIITDPSGAELKIHNLDLFCRTNNFSPSSLRNVVSGRRRHHKGYKVRHA